MLNLCAVLCGAEDYEDIENYGKEKMPFLNTFLSLENILGRISAGAKSLIMIEAIREKKRQ